MVQKQPGHPVPRYDLISQKGPSHQPVFQVKGTAQWNGEELEEEGQGNTIKAAEKNAAERLLLRIRGKKQPPLPPVSEGEPTARCMFKPNCKHTCPIPSIFSMVIWAQ